MKIIIKSSLKFILIYKFIKKNRTSSNHYHFFYSYKIWIIFFNNNYNDSAVLYTLMLIELLQKFLS